MTEVKHIIMARRHRSKDYQEWSNGGDDTEDDDEEDTGHDANGYDDGSWRGDNGNYGDSTDEKNSSKHGKHSKSANKAKDTSTVSDDADTADESDAVDTGKKSSKFKTVSDDSDSQATASISSPALSGKVKTTSKSAKGDDQTSDGEDDDDTTGTETTDDDADTKSTSKTNWSSSTASATSTADGASSATSTPKTLNKSVKSGKSAQEDESDATAGVDDATSVAEADSGIKPSADCATLKQIYNEMGGTSWTYQDGWASAGNGSCCSAYGVSCDSEGKVTALDLGNNDVSGTLSASLFLLSNLQRLNMTGNAITGTLPDQFSTLAQLSTLYLDANSLGGEIPSSLQNSSSLNSLHISNNSLDGMLYLPNALNLTQLYASKNAFTYLNINANTALQKLALDDNSFNCSLPEAAGFTSLQTFSIARNGFTGQIFDVTALTNLTKLDLSHNLLSGPFPDVTKLASLSYLNLQGLDLSGQFPTGSSPPSLTTCHIDPILTSDCPSTSVMKSPSSLASKCGLQCRGGGKPMNAVKESTTGADTTSEDNDTSVMHKASNLRLPGAGNQEGSTVEGDDSGQTPASLAAMTSSAGASRQAWLGGVLRKGGRRDRSLGDVGVAAWPMAILGVSMLCILL